MSLVLNRPDILPPLAELRGAADRILEIQTPDGAIPWFEGGPWDAWNHAESVMGLAVMGEAEAASRGLEYLARTQRPDGSWMGGYGNALPMVDRVRISREPGPEVCDTNFIAYPAVAVWHAVRLSGDELVARRYWPMVRAALNFVLRFQHADGDISWCAEAHGSDVDDAVLAGAASIYKSLTCGLKLAALVGDPQPGWETALRSLGTAILCRPHRFDRLQDRSGFAMDWYYPVLAGVMPAAAGLARMESRARRFIVQGRGSRCVAAEPWVTVAESCECAMTLVAIGAVERAQTLLSWQLAHRDSDGAFWMGWQFDEQIVWPQEQPGWTQAAAILAFDAVQQATPAWDVLVKA